MRREIFLTARTHILGITTAMSVVIIGNVKTNGVKKEMLTAVDAAGPRRKTILLIMVKTVTRVKVDAVRGVTHVQINK